MEGSGLFAAWGWPGVIAVIVAAGALIGVAWAVTKRALVARPPAWRPQGEHVEQTQFPAPAFERSSHRMSLIDLVGRAGKRGWDVSGRNVQIMDFLRGLREAGLAGQIRMWGRPNRNAPDAVARTELHRQIPPDHFKDFEFDVGTIASREDNFDTRTCDLRQSDRHAGGYIDIYVDRQTALDWLDGDAEKFRRPMNA